MKLIEKMKVYGLVSFVVLLVMLVLYYGITVLCGLLWNLAVRLFVKDWEKYKVNPLKVGLPH